MAKCHSRSTAPSLQRQRERHGQRTTRLYNIWQKMKARCYRPGDKDYRLYGARGIVICTEWRDSFTGFWKWATSHCYADDLTLDRINSDGDYQPSNCRWTTWQQQRLNNKQPKSKTGYIGVCEVSGSKPFKASIGGKGRRYLGKFAIKEEAARAYDAAALERYGKNAVLNFPSGT